MGIYLLQGLTLGFAAVVQPGPFMAYLITQTLTHGFRKTWTVAFAPLISDGPIIALALLVLIQMPPWLQRGLNLVSGAFILYLAWGSYRQWRSFTALEGQFAPAGNQSVFKAATMNALNPMPYIYWSLVTGPILIAGWRESPAFGLTFLGGFYLIMVSGLLAIMGLFDTARQLGNRVSRILLGISVLALAGFGLFQLGRGIFA
jgi:threonine/homoserine/homoserine lactone efflux protein